jgi:hypothetical protein
MIGNKAVEMNRTPHHLPLHARKSLCGRTLVLEHQMAHLAIGVEGAAGEELAPIYDDLLQAARKGCSNKAHGSLGCNTVRLDAFLQTLAKWTEGHRSVQASRNPELLPILDSLSKQLTEIDCAKCGNHVCDGSDADHHTVETAGECIKPFRTMYENVLKRTLALYRSYVPDFDAIPPPVVHFNTESATRPHHFGECAFVGGTTRYDDSTRRSVSIVTLMVAPEDFDLASRQAVGYVLFHECFCHAFQGLRGAGRRESTPPEDPFAEGWMDWIAKTLLGELASECDWPTVFVDTGVLLHRARRNVRAAQSATDKRQRTVIEHGAGAAEKLHRFIRKIRTFDDPPTDSDRDFLRISLALNLEGGIAARRRRFVQFINDSLPDIGHFPDERARGKVASIVHKFLVNKNLNELLNF